MDYEAIIVESIDSIRRITFNCPDKLNALSSQLLGELKGAIDEAASDPDCRCVLLTGSGRGFSSGADLTEKNQNLQSGEGFDFKASLDTRYHPIIRQMRGMAKPVLVAVNGIAAGAGCNLALAGDIVLAASSAKFIQAFVRIGLVPDASGTWTIPRLIGRARAMRWMMSGEAIDASTAEQWGLIAGVVEDESLADEALTMARQLAAGPTLALAGIKELIDQSLENNLDEQLDREGSMQNRAGNSGDFIEGVSAFIEKRATHFGGK